MKYSQHGGIGISKQFELLNNAVENSAIWLYKRNSTGPEFSTSEPDKCKKSINSKKCGLFLSEFAPDNISKKEFLHRIDEHIQTIDPPSRGFNKCFLLISDLSYMGSPTGSFGLGTIISRIMHTEIVVGKSLFEAKNAMYGWDDSDSYNTYNQEFQHFTGKIYGLIYLGYLRVSGRYGFFGADQVIERVSKAPLPPNQSIKLDNQQRHPHSRWKDDTYTDGDGVQKNYCDKVGNELSIEELFIPNEYDFLKFNCQSFCKAFMSILRCDSNFKAFTFNGRTNFKLDVTQLSALKKIFMSEYVPEPEPPPPVPDWVDGGGIKRKSKLRKNKRISKKRKSKKHKRSGKKSKRRKSKTKRR
tara:strand:- start:487 stop:1557 length:1071 start_codon:yes stop_codon:yes gene_type:complete